ncbi:MAG TPA: lamin tail domain-containing protein [Chitinophagales bacterium]|nr:lamin tail domain-containing protein [Chitinophagales bacterium]
MKKISILFLLALGLLTIHGCVKDRQDNINFFKDHAGSSLDSSGAVVINEFVAAGATQVNEFGLATDWIELYNTGDSTVNFANTNYYITDDSTQPEKFKINQLSIPGKGYMVVYADDSAQILTQVHTNFGLSKTGEFVGLFRKRTGGGYDTLTWHPFGPQGTNVSEGRYPDGGTTWTNFPNPTPGAANHL